MSQILLHNARVVLDGRVANGSLLVRGGRIARVFSDEQAPVGLAQEERVDCRGDYLAAGMIDIHIHGSAGVDAQASDEKGLGHLSEFLMSEGVTGYFPTFVPAGDAGYREAIENIERFAGSGQKRAGARVLGIHFEGPFVSPHKCGALKREHFRTYTRDPRSLELFTGRKQEEHKELARLMTLAPEIEGGLELTAELARGGVRPFIGHSAADIETLDRAVEAGARHITHFPNALDPLHHRKPGAVAWGLVRGDVTIDCIADFHHIHPLMLRLMIQSKSEDRIALISDAIMATGLGEGEYTVWDLKIAVRGGITALVGGAGAGSIAGSVITMREALKNVVSLGVPVHSASRMASLVPARVAGISEERGSIEEGKRADLIAFDDEIKIKFTMIEGEMG
jgi:N-acetylglucosamine-6-phosphate deacetylase